MPDEPVSTPPPFAKLSSLLWHPVLNHMQITICQACQYRHLLHPRNCRHFVGFCLESYANYNMPSRLVSTPPRSAKLSSLSSLVLCIFLPRCILRWKLCKKRAPRRINNDFAYSCSRRSAARDYVMNAAEAPRFFNFNFSKKNYPHIFECTAPRV